MIGLASRQAKSRKQKESIGTASNVCNACASEVVFIDQARGETICSNCGLVLSDRSIDLGPEWRAFTADEQNARQRVGGPADWSKFDQGLTTIIGRQNVDAAGRKLTSTRRAQIHRLRKWQIRTKVHSSDKRNLAVAMTELHRISSQLSIPYSIRETSAVIYRKALRKRLTRGRTILGMIAASLYLACRVHKVPRPLEEIVDQIHITRKELSLCVRLILRYLNLKVPQSSPVEFVHRFGTELGIPGEAKKKAIDILQLAREERLTIGKDPKGMAAAAIYVASILTGSRRTQLEIARTARVTEVTVRNRYKEMVEKLGISTT
ncbi:MAG: transcription initiation factor IIB [Candidatus Thorarchaeota archaeon]|nr:transcription initiation factor IIB [Candidatus Thorarchaeota archaeon]MCK5239387.1 transcription initiation factor IIB [Candidatus Thorarchaeota archaeon]